MQQDQILDLPFKGAREYLHSTDILPALIEMAHERFGPLAHVESLSIRRPIRCAILATFEPSPVFSGSFRIRSGSDSFSGKLVETDRPVTRRIPFYLPPVSDVAVTGQGFARILEPQQGYATLDMAVGLMKLVAGQMDNRHWWLCQLNLVSPLTEVYPIEIRIRHHLGGRFLVFDILQADTVIGSARGIQEDAST
jgi:hypothetical protein